MPSAGDPAVDGVCAGAGAILAMALDYRLATPEARPHFYFARESCRCRYGACGILPRIIGQGRAAELLFTGRSMSAEEGRAWGFYNGLTELRWYPKRSALQADLATGPWFAHSMTRRCSIRNGR